MTPLKPYFLFTHTPLHVGSGKSVGYVDQPIQRETHTRIPIVPGSSLKGVLRDRFKSDPDVDWLFGKESAEHAGALLVSEARVLAFPVRSAKGCFAWITCPLVLRRAERDGVLTCGVDLGIFKPVNDQDEEPDKRAIAGNGHPYSQ
jgi:CRISPR-associated protein Cmr4